MTRRDGVNEELEFHLLTCAPQRAQWDRERRRLLADLDKATRAEQAASGRVAALSAAARQLLVQVDPALHETAAYRRLLALSRGEEPPAEVRREESRSVMAALLEEDFFEGGVPFRDADVTEDRPPRE